GLRGQFPDGVDEPHRGLTTVDDGDSTEHPDRALLLAVCDNCAIVQRPYSLPGTGWPGYVGTDACYGSPVVGTVQLSAVAHSAGRCYRSVVPLDPGSRRPPRRPMYVLRVAVCVATVA